MNENRRNFRVINATDDIVGAKADTFLHSIRSNRRVDPNLPNYMALDGQKVDSSAVSVGKSIVFASLIKEHDIVWAQHSDNGKDSKAYVVASVGNIGLSGHHNTEKKEKGGAARRSTAPTSLTNSGEAVGSSSSRAVAGGGTPDGAMRGGGGSSRLTPAEKKQVTSRQEEIRLVRELT